MLQRRSGTMIYADWNATTPPSAVVLDAMRRAAETAWGNPSSVHGPGRAARAHVERAREAVGALAGFDPRDVVFTSGGTEANNIAVRSLAKHAPDATLLTSAVEHPSILRPWERLVAEGRRVELLPVEPSGVLDLRALASALERGPTALSIQLVNHETGVVQPMQEILALAGRAGAPVHVDAVQGIGHLPPATWVGAAALTLTAHKLQGPKGIGAVVARPSLRLTSLVFGGAQERGVRPGTVDPVACAGFAEAARHAADARAIARLGDARDALEAALVSRGGVVNGGAPRVAHVTNVSFPGWLGPELVAALDLEGVAVSSGAACTAGTTDPSPVIAAMVGVDRARSAVRFSLGPHAEATEVSQIVAAIDRVLGRSGPFREIA